MATRRKGPLSRGLKAVGKSRALWGVVGWYLGLCRRTARWELHGTEPLRELARRPEGFVMAFWHECLPIMPLAWARFWEGLDASVPRKPGLVLVSRSRDGTMISSALGKYGLTVVAGSSSRGGREAGLNLLRGVRAGGIAVVVPDGPRGPRREVSEGPVRLAAMAGVPIVPCGAYAVPSRRMGSWDRMILPLPFARCVAVVGAPILPEAREPGVLAAALAESLNGCMARAEALCGVGGAPEG
jgi:lysophospholipid acyltransferase (LPLAT)-like uncharacterized protein